MVSYPWPNYAMDRMRTRSWEELIRDTKAHQLLKEGRHDDISINDLTAATDTFLRKSLVGFPRREKIRPRTSECYLALLAELGRLQNELYVHEVGLVACLGALLPDDAKALLRKHRAMILDDLPWMKYRMDAYLRILLLAHPMKVFEWTSDCEIAVRDLLKIVVSNSRGCYKFPPITRVLSAFKNESFQELIPLELLEETLIQVGYKECLSRTMNDLRDENRWHELHCLVDGLGVVWKLEHVQGLQQLIKYLFPEIGVWTSWKPSKDRIRRWETKIDESLGLRLNVTRITALEGPDYKGFRSTLRCSDHLEFRHAVRKVSQRNSVDILDHLLHVFDKAVAKDTTAINFCAKVCSPENLKSSTLYRVDACIALLDPLHLDAMGEFLLPFKENQNFDQLQIVANGLEVLRTNPQLQRAIEHSREESDIEPAREFAKRAAFVLKTGQKAFSKKLGSSSPNRPFANRIATLGRVLLNSKWLHKHLRTPYLDMLKRIPSDVELKSWFQQLELPVPRSVKEDIRETLDKRLCAMTRPGASAAPTPAAPLVNHRAFTMNLDRHRENLRRILIDVRLVWGLSLADVVACIEQSELEHETFIDTVCDKLEAASTDHSCFELVRYLGRRCNLQISDVPPLAQCWRDLLIHVLRRREPNLLERWADTLSPSSWRTLTQNLLLLYPERYSDDQSDLRFSPARFAALASRVGIGPRASVRTTSTESSTLT